LIGRDGAFSGLLGLEKLEDIQLCGDQEAAEGLDI
jgi:hypothetical protein